MKLKVGDRIRLSETYWPPMSQPETVYAYGELIEKLKNGLVIVKIDGINKQKTVKASNITNNIYATGTGD